MSTVTIHSLPFSEAVAANGMLYISGQVGIDPATGTLVNQRFQEEATQVMKNLGSVLAHHQLNYQQLVNVTIYLTDMDQYAVANEVYRGFFTGRFPARVCIAVKELPLGAKIEICGIAQLQQEKS